MIVSLIDHFVINAHFIWLGKKFCKLVAKIWMFPNLLEKHYIECKIVENRQLLLLIFLPFWTLIYTYPFMLVQSKDFHVYNKA